MFVRQNRSWAPARIVGFCRRDDPVDLKKRQVCFVRMALTLPSLEINLGVFSDCKHFDPEVLDEMCAFLARLQKNPYHPDILNHCEKRGAKYAIEFVQGFAVYWRLRQAGANKSVRIEVLKAAKIEDIL